MERIPFERIEFASESKPASISSIRLLPRQCRLVGKLMI